MKKMILMMIAIGCLFVVAQEEETPHRSHGNHRQHMSQLDTNGDGLISMEEFSTGTTEHFNQLDANEDGFISEDEMPQRGRGHRRMGGMIIGLADSDQSGDISAAEWEAFLAAITVEGSNEVDPDALHELIAGRHEGDGEHARRGPHGPRGAHGEGHGHPGDLNENGVFDTDDLGTIFANLDSDGDGALSAEELPQRRRFKQRFGHKRGH